MSKKTIQVRFQEDYPERVDEIVTETVQLEMMDDCYVSLIIEGKHFSIRRIGKELIITEV